MLIVCDVCFFYFFGWGGGFCVGKALQFQISNLGAFLWILLGKSCGKCHDIIVICSKYRQYL